MAEAELLIACLVDFPASIEPELSATRQRIATLRREVDRLRGMPAIPAHRKTHPDWLKTTGSGSPWTIAGTMAPAKPKR